MSLPALLRRVGQAFLVLALAYTGAYVLLAALPGDSVMARYGSPDLGLTEEQIAEIRESYGMDRHPVIRYFDSIGAFLRGTRPRAAQRFRTSLPRRCPRHSCWRASASLERYFSLW